MMDIKVTMNISGLENTLETLKKLPKDVTTNTRGGMVNLAMRKGTRLMVSKLRPAAQAAIDKDGSVSTGLLASSLTTRRAKYNGKGHKLNITVRKRVYPPRTKGQTRKTDTHQTARYLEYGTVKQAATPWIRPTFNKMAQQTIDTIVDDLNARIDKAAAKYLSEGD